MHSPKNGAYGMNGEPFPLVSILTPVFNCADHLAECIESVLAQTYANWDYTIVDNCSTDGSFAIAQKYAAKEPRIRVLSNDRFLPIILNHNHTIRQISPDSKYCKFVFADDWLYPECIEQMVRLAERNPGVGLVGTYMMDGSAVIFSGPSYPCQRISGRELSRNKLLGGPYIFGTMTSLLINSDLVRKRPAFFNSRNLHSDHEACLDMLQETDFGFVHQVLCFSRVRRNSNGSFAKDFDSIVLGEMVTLLKYGPVYLDAREYSRRLRETLWIYHRVLARNVLRFRSSAFWRYHKEALAAFGAKIEPWLLAKTVVIEILSHLGRPRETVAAMLRWWPADANRASKQAINGPNIDVRGGSGR